MLGTTSQNKDNKTLGTTVGNTKTLGGMTTGGVSFGGTGTGLKTNNQGNNTFTSCF